MSKFRADFEKSDTFWHLTLKIRLFRIILHEIWGNGSSNCRAAAAGRCGGSGSSGEILQIWLQKWNQLEKSPNMHISHVWWTCQHMSTYSVLKKTPNLVAFCTPSLIGVLSVFREACRGYHMHYTCTSRFEIDCSRHWFWTWFRSTWLDIDT